MNKAFVLVSDVMTEGVLANALPTPLVGGNLQIRNLSDRSSAEHALHS